MPYFVYIIQSQTTKKLYIGQTNNLEGRLKRHNKGEVKSTSKYKLWLLIYSKKFSSRSETIKIERYLKSLKNPKYILEKIVSKQSGPVV
ncbi:MAG: GIY-YIG nuclease family protein [Patescibacteria group bacterium]